METKSKRINLSRIEKYTADKKCFGWEVASQDDLKPNNTIVLTLQREQKNIEDYKTVKKLEKQYDKLNRRFPLLPLILVGVGGLFLLLYFLLKGKVIFYLAFIYISLTSFCVAVFALVVFLFLLIKKKELSEILMSEASRRAGLDNNFPNKHNIKEDTDYTGALINSINGK